MLGFRHAFWQFHAKAPEDWRTPKPGGPACGLDSREASWTAVVLPPSRHDGGYRFFPTGQLLLQTFSKLFWPASPAVSALRSVSMISRKKLNINSMKTNVIPAQPASAFGAPPSGDPGLVNAELRTASRPRYPALKFALLSLLAALCFAAPRAHASGGTVIGWGYNLDGEVNIPADLSGVTAIAAGDLHSLALKSDGTVVGWGDNSYGQLNIPADLSGVTAIAAGDFHSLALKLPNRPPARCQNVTVSAGADCAATVTVNEHEPLLPELSEAEQVTVVIPFEKVEPLGGVHETGTVPSQLSVAVAL